MKTMLIDCIQDSEIRIAIMENNILIDLHIENYAKIQKKANIYKGKISRIEQSLNAVFVNYGEDRNGFLPYKEISSEYFIKKTTDILEPENNVNTTSNINNFLSIGQEIIVQISKDERGNKGAALTTFITLAGCHLVLLPNNENAGGVSKQIEGIKREKIINTLSYLKKPENMSIVIRTAAIDRSVEELQQELNNLICLWENIKKISNNTRAPNLIHKDSDISIRIIRDYIRDDINEIFVNDINFYKQLKLNVSNLKPNVLNKIKIYNKKIPLFQFFKISEQLETVFKRKLQLPSGGSIVIDLTEALTSIDINSSKANKNDNIEETALYTNLEATVEISRQLKLRDIGGLIVVDFIDMSVESNQMQVENKLMEHLSKDKAKIQMTRISKLGLVEISRQRLKSSLGKSDIMQTCPNCFGNGTIKSLSSISTNILSKINHEIIKNNEIKTLKAILPLSVTSFIFNYKRNNIINMETEYNIKIILISDTNMKITEYKFENVSNISKEYKNNKINNEKKFNKKFYENNNQSFANKKKIFYNKDNFNKNFNKEKYSLFNIKICSFFCKKINSIANLIKKLFSICKKKDNSNQDINNKSFIKDKKNKKLKYSNNKKSFNKNKKYEDSNINSYKKNFQMHDKVGLINIKKENNTIDLSIKNLESNVKNLAPNDTIKKDNLFKNSISSEVTKILSEDNILNKPIGQTNIINVDSNFTNETYNKYLEIQKIDLNKKSDETLNIKAKNKNIDKNNINEKSKDNHLSYFPSIDKSHQGFISKK